MEHPADTVDSKVSHCEAYDYLSIYLALPLTAPLSTTGAFLYKLSMMESERLLAARVGNLRDAEARQVAYHSQIYFSTFNCKT
jgi:hypothetical protein